MYRTGTLYSPVDYYDFTETVVMNSWSQMVGGLNRLLPKEINANRFFWDSHWLEIWSNHFCPSMGPNGGSVAMGSGLTRLSFPCFNTNVFYAKTLQQQKIEIRLSMVFRQAAAAYQLLLLHLNIFKLNSEAFDQILCTTAALWVWIQTSL
jgi:hypothetical protein